MKPPQPLRAQCPISHRVRVRRGCVSELFETEGKEGKFIREYVCEASKACICTYISAYTRERAVESVCALTLILRGLWSSCLIQRYSTSLNYIWWSFHTEVSKCRCHGLCVFAACRFQTACCSISAMLWSSPVELYWLQLLISALLHIRFFTRLSHCTRLKPRVALHPWQPSCQSSPYLWMFHIPWAQVRIHWIL